MGPRKITTVKLTQLVVILFLSLVLVSNFAFAKTNGDDELSKEDKFLMNLLKGMESEHNGLKNSCIFMVGKYKLEGASHNLVEQAKNSENDRVLQLIAWSLYEIGNEEHLEEFQTLTENYKSEKVKEIVSYLEQIKRLEKSVAISD